MKTKLLALAAAFALIAGPALAQEAAKTDAAPAATKEAPKAHHGKHGKKAGKRHHAKKVEKKAEETSTDAGATVNK